MSPGESSTRAPGRGVLFGVGWWALVVLTALFALNHIAGVWAFASSDDERMMFLVFAALQLLALAVLLVPYRRLEVWAWWAMWIPILAMAATYPVFLSTLGIVYLAVAAAMALAQFATLPAMRRSARSA